MDTGNHGCKANAGTRRGDLHALLFVSLLFPTSLCTEMPPATEPFPCRHGVWVPHTTHMRSGLPTELELKTLWQWLFLALSIFFRGAFVRRVRCPSVLMVCLPPDSGQAAAPRPGWRWSTWSHPRRLCARLVPRREWSHHIAILLKKPLYWTALSGEGSTCEVPAPTQVATPEVTHATWVKLPNWHTGASKLRGGREDFKGLWMYC